MANAGDKLTKFLFGAAGVGIVLVLVTLLRAVVLRDLWTWFVEPLGVPGIGVAHAAGISTILGFLTYQVHQQTDEEKQRGGLFNGIYATVMGVMMALASWGIGAAAHSYM